MPVLKNSRHEQFAQAVATGNPASKAYVIAGYLDNDGNAARLNGNEQVVARVQELNSAAADEAVTDAAWILKQLRQVYEAAMRAGKLSVANRSLELLGKNQGLFADRSQDESVPQGKVVFVMSEKGR